MARRFTQGLLVTDGEQFRINGTTFVLDGQHVVSLQHYEQTRHRQTPLCAICDTDQPVRICAACSARLMAAGRQ